MPPFVSKPAILYHLEDINSDSTVNLCLTNGQKLSAIELIVFIFNILKNNLNYSRSLPVKHLYIIIKKHMNKELLSICDHNCQSSANWSPNSVINGSGGGQQTDDELNSYGLILNNLINDFIGSKILAVDRLKQTIALSFSPIDGHLTDDDWIQCVDQMISDSLITVFKNFLTVQLQKYGRKLIDDIEIRLVRDHNYLFKVLFSEKTSYRLIDFIDSNPMIFTVNCVRRDYDHNNNNDNTNDNEDEESKQNTSSGDTYIDINPNLLTTEMYLNFQLLYKFGPQITQMIGRVHSIEDHSAIVMSRVDDVDPLKDIVFNINMNCTEIFGKLINEIGINVFMHLDDRITFDAKLMMTSSVETPSANNTNTNNINNRHHHRNTDYNDHYSWFITKITKVRHSAHCFIMQSNGFAHHFAATHQPSLVDYH